REHHEHVVVAVGPRVADRTAAAEDHTLRVQVVLHGIDDPNAGGRDLEAVERQGSHWSTSVSSSSEGRAGRRPAITAAATSAAAVHVRTTSCTEMNSGMPPWRNRKPASCVTAATPRMAAPTRLRWESRYIPTRYTIE